MSDEHTETKTSAPHTEPKTPVPPVATPPAPRDTAHKKTAFITAIIVGGSLLLLALGVTSGMVIQNATLNKQTTTQIGDTHDGNETVTQEESSIAAVAEKVSPSVVSIVTQTRTRSFYGINSGQAAGTGIFISKDGYLITNNHVVQGAQTVSVVDNEGNLYENVSIIGRDPLNDIAFLKVNNSDKEFTPASIGNSSTVRIGQQVVAIGNALGQYSNTVTSGIISGTGRPVTADAGDGETESLTDLIQTDASINPGNSGGPLVNMAGQVIGINTAIAEDANGIGFAIPINATKGVIASVLETGKVSRAFLGVNYVSITPEVAREYKLSVKNGAYVYAESGSPIQSGSPAAQAGLRNGDIILKVNSDTIGLNGGLSSIIGQYKAGDKVTITYLRDGKEATTSLTFSAYNG